MNEGSPSGFAVAYSIPAAAPRRRSGLIEFVYGGRTIYVVRLAVVGEYTMSVIDIVAELILSSAMARLPPSRPM